MNEIFTIEQLLAIAVPVIAVVIAHLLAKRRLQAIAVNVDGNLSKALDMTARLTTKVDISVKELEELRLVVADQATAIMNLTGAVARNGKGAA